VNPTTQLPNYPTNQSVSPALRHFILFVDRLVVFVADHWLLLVSLSLVVFAGLPFLAPVLMHWGYTDPAQLIYMGYRLTCHQLPYRSWFLFGEQPVYTLDQLRAALSVDTDDIFFWTTFQGNPQLGYKVAWCERDTAMYISLLIAGLAFGLVRRRLKPLDWRAYLLFLAPMAIDGTTQLIGLRESDWLWRSITGALFGVGSVWLVYPYVEAAMRDVQAQAREQWRKAVISQSVISNQLPD
jgi:uncharacterized membrane protein